MQFNTNASSQNGEQNANYEYFSTTPRSYTVSLPEEPTQVHFNNEQVTRLLIELNSGYEWLREQLLLTQGACVTKSQFEYLLTQMNALRESNNKLQQDLFDLKMKNEAAEKKCAELKEMNKNLKKRIYSKPNKGGNGNVKPKKEEKPQNRGQIQPFIDDLIDLI